MCDFGHVWIPVEDDFLETNDFESFLVGGDDLEITFMYDRVSIWEIEIPSLKISPNPVEGTATIIKDADVTFTSIDVVDIMGNLVMTIKNPENTINLSSLATGSYIVRFHTAKGFAIRSIIKN